MSAFSNSSATVSSALGHQLGDFDSSGLLAHIALDVGALDVAVRAPPPQQSTNFVDMLADLYTISSSIDCVEEQVRTRRQQRRSVRATSVGEAVAAKSTPRSRRVSTPSERVRVGRPAAKNQGKSNTSGVKVSGAKAGVKNRGTAKRKKDDDALDCIYAEIQDSVGMCRYWGKKCWNLRVPKPKGGFHSLCHFHRAKANDNQRRFDFKRRGTLWREFVPDPDTEDISLFPTVPGELLDDFASVEAEDQSRPETAAKFEPFARPVALQDQDVELLQELVGAATICEF